MKLSTRIFIWLWALAFFFLGIPLTFLIIEKQNVWLALAANTIEMVLLGLLLHRLLREGAVKQLLKRVWPMWVFLFALPMLAIIFLSGTSELPPGAIALNFLLYVSLPQFFFGFIYLLVRHWWKTSRFTPPFLVALIIHSIPVTLLLLYFIGI